MEKIHKNIRVFMLSCIKHACFHVFSPFSAYFSPHDIIAEKGLLTKHMSFSLQCAIIPKTSTISIVPNISSIDNIN